jgi:hypothetical protein
MTVAVEGGRLYYAFSWWLYPASRKYSWQALGLGGQSLMVFPQQNLIVVFTGWGLQNEADMTLLVPRLLPAVKAAACTGTTQENNLPPLQSGSQTDSRLW